MTARPMIIRDCRNCGELVGVGRRRYCCQRCARQAAYLRKRNRDPFTPLEKELREKFVDDAKGKT